MKFLENVARDLCACQRLVNFWDDDVVISRLRIPYRKPGFQEESFTSLWHAHKSRATFSRNFTRNFPQRALDVRFLNHAC